MSHNNIYQICFSDVAWFLIVQLIDTNVDSGVIKIFDGLKMPANVMGN